MCCYNTVQYSFTVMCVCYCNMLLQLIQYRVTVMCVCYCNVLLLYNTVQRYGYVCVLL